MAVPSTPAVGYSVHVGRGVIEQLPALLHSHCPAHRYAVVADHRVAELHGAALNGVLAAAGLQTDLVTVPSGEWNKTREQWAECTDRLLAAGLGRDAALIAFGGGVAGDLGGFVAATYLRGIPFVQVPTTLLAMIDASIGGKTGVDVKAGKNLVGAFHQPRVVVADIAWLATLPRAHVAAGMAEAIKHGAIRDEAYFESLAEARPCLARDLDHLEPVVRRSIEIKAEIVASDVHEAGRRQILNFGHTVGHAVEALSGYELLHGEAVAIGMATEALAAEVAGIAAEGTHRRLVAMLERYALPTAVPDDLDVDKVMDVMRGDKKTREGRVRFAVPQTIGKPAQDTAGGWTVELGAQVLRQALDSGRPGT